jgi:hypothetical protein
MSTPNRKSSLFWAYGAIALVLAFQVYFSVEYCNSGIFGLFVPTLIVLAPAIGFSFTRNPYRTVGACLGILPFLYWANLAECVRPYPGGGAAMAYVAVFLFGIPVSVLMGFLAGGITQPKLPLR